MRCRLALGIVAGALVAGSAGAAAPQPAAIVFATVPGVQDLAVQSEGGVRRLTRTRWYEGLPVWSPDRRRIAFVAVRGRSADIWVMDADGTGARPLADEDARRTDELYPAWSPDGRSIAFVSRHEGSGHVYAMRADGTGVRRLTHTGPGVENTQPVFSPDGRYVVLSSTRRSGRFELYRVRAADGGGARRLTFGGSAMMADYSPDGTRIVFVWRRGGRAALWTVRSGGGGLRRIVGHAERDVAYPRFSPDGRTILYTVLKAGEEEFDSRLWTVRLDGSGRTQLGRGTEGDW